jgi:Acyl carrier protein
VIVERRPLPGTPGHHDGGIAEIVVAVQQAPRVAVRPHAMKPFGESDGVAADGILQLLLDLPGDRGRVAQPHGRVDSREQRIQAVGHPDSISSAFRQFCNPAVPPPRNLSFLYGVVIFLPTSYMVQPASASLEHTVIDVLKNVSRRPIEPTMDSDLVADLGFDSLQVLELVAELEDRFDVSIPLNDVPSTRTVAQIVAQVARLVGERPTA